MPHPAAIGEGGGNAICSASTVGSIRALNALLPAYTPPLEDSEIGTFPPTGVSLVMELPGNYPRTSEALIIVATKRADHVVLPEFYAVLAAVESDGVETIVPYSIVRR